MGEKLGWSFGRGGKSQVSLVALTWLDRCFDVGLIWRLLNGCLGRWMCVVSCRSGSCLTGSLSGLGED